MGSWWSNPLVDEIEDLRKELNIIQEELDAVQIQLIKRDQQLDQKQNQCNSILNRMEWYMVLVSEEMLKTPGEIVMLPHIWVKPEWKNGSLPKRYAKWDIAAIFVGRNLRNSGCEEMQLYKWEVISYLSERTEYERKMIVLSEADQKRILKN